MNKGTIIQILNPEAMGMHRKCKNKLAVVLDNETIRLLEGFKDDNNFHCMKGYSDYGICEAHIIEGHIHIVL